MKIVYILQVSSHARYWRRIEKLKKMEIESVVLAFEREKFYKGKKKSKEYIYLGNIEQENYGKRIWPLLKSIRTIRKKIKDADVVYTFGLDTFLIGWFAQLFSTNKPKFVYEVGDIRTVFTSTGIKSKIFRRIEKFILKKTNLLVVTSEAFVTGYFKRIQRVSNIDYHVIENKPELKVELSKTKINENSKIRIGYFGVLRCKRTFEVLEKLLKNHSDKFELYIRGIITEGQDIVDRMRKMDNVKIEGEYSVPDDLPSMYKQIDIVWACYPYQGGKTGNWMWAKTTRFYEACYFNKPMIVLAGTQDSNYVKEKGIGISLNLSDVKASVDKLSMLTHYHINDMIKSYKEVPSSVYKYKNEHQELIEKLKK